MRLTLATWNMDHWKRTPAQRRAAWSKLQAWGLDVAMLQECVPPRGFDGGGVLWREIGMYRRFGSGVVARRDWPLEEIETVTTCHSPAALSLRGTFPGSVVVASVMPPETDPITVISIYGVIEVYAITTVLRQLADLVPLFDSPYGERVVLGGDLNISTQDSGSGADAARGIFAFLDSVGLVNLFERVDDRPPPLGERCSCRDEHCYHVVTHRNANSSTGGSHLDYLFATEGLAAQTRTMRLLDDPETWELSDHCPVVAEIDVDPATLPRTWRHDFATDVEDTLRAVLAEPRTWTAWQPGTSRPSVRSDRSLRRWIAVFWEGTLADGTPSQIEMGIWRGEEETGLPLVAHLGLHSTPMGQELPVTLNAPADNRVSIVTSKNHRYLVTAIEEGSLPDEACRLLLDAFVVGTTR